MRILYVVGDPTISVSDSTGYARHIRECIHALEGLGHEVRILTSGGEHTSGQRKTFGRVKRYMPRILSTALKDMARLRYDARFRQRIEDEIKEFQPDFIYNRHALFHKSGVETGLRLGVPVILEVNATVTQESVKYFDIALKSSVDSYERFALKKATAIVVVSSPLKEDVLRFDIPSGKVYVNPNGADPERFSPDVDSTEVRRKHGLEGNIVIGFLGSCAPWHGVPNLLEAARVICPKHPDVRLLIVGAWGDDRTAFHKTREYGLGDTVVFAGAVPLDEAPMYIGAMDIATAPYADPTQVYGSSTKFYEYMASGKAIVASNVAQMGEVIEDGITGLLVKPGDSADLTEKLIHLLDKPELRREMGIRAREVALANHTWKQNAERIIRVAESVVGKAEQEGGMG